MKTYTVTKIQNRRLKELLVEFETAARLEEWQRDQGSCQKTISDAIQRFSDAENKLVGYLYRKGLK